MSLNMNQRNSFQNYKREDLMQLIFLTMKTWFFEGIIIQWYNGEYYNIIEEQTDNNGNCYAQEQSELYLEDVHLISKDGKVHYLSERKVD